MLHVANPSIIPWGTISEVCDGQVYGAACDDPITSVISPDFTSATLRLMYRLYDIQNRAQLLNLNSVTQSTHRIKAQQLD